MNNPVSEFFILISAIIYLVFKSDLIFMRRTVLALMIAVVLVSGCIGGSDQPENDDNLPDSQDQNNQDQTQDADQDDEQRTDEYAGATTNFSSADERLDYTDDAEIAAKPVAPGNISTHAGFATVPPNHGGQQFEDFRVIYQHEAVTNVSAEHVKIFMLDAGGNDTLANPGSEDYLMEVSTVEINQEGREMRLVPADAPDYNMTLDDRVMFEVNNIRNPDRGLKTVEMEVNTAETDRVYPDPVSATLEIGQ